MEVQCRQHLPAPRVEQQQQQQHTQSWAADVEIKLLTATDCSAVGGSYRPAAQQLHQQLQQEGLEQEQQGEGWLQAQLQAKEQLLQQKVQQLQQQEEKLHQQDQQLQQQGEKLHQQEEKLQQQSEQLQQQGDDIRQHHRICHYIQTSLGGEAGNEMRRLTRIAGELERYEEQKVRRRQQPALLQAVVQQQEILQQQLLVQQQKLQTEREAAQKKILKLQEENFRLQSSVYALLDDDDNDTQDSIGHSTDGNPDSDYKPEDLPDSALQMQSPMRLVAEAIPCISTRQQQLSQLANLLHGRPGDLEGMSLTAACGYMVGLAEQQGQSDVEQVIKDAIAAMKGQQAGQHGDGHGCRTGLGHGREDETVPGNRKGDEMGFRDGHGAGLGHGNGQGVAVGSHGKRRMQTIGASGRRARKVRM